MKNCFADSLKSIAVLKISRAISAVLDTPSRVYKIKVMNELTRTVGINCACTDGYATSGVLLDGRTASWEYKGPGGLRIHLMGTYIDGTTMEVVHSVFDAISNTLFPRCNWDCTDSHCAIYLREDGVFLHLPDDTYYRLGSWRRGTG